MNKVISIKWVAILLLFALVIGYFGEDLLRSQINLNYFNTLEVTGKIVVNSKIVLEKNQLQIKLVSVLRVPDTSVLSSAPVRGVRDVVKVGEVVTIDIVDNNLKYAKTGSLVTMICKEGQDKFFNCEYKISPKQLCPVPTPTPKPTPKPKVKSK